MSKSLVLGTAAAAVLLMFPGTASAATASAPRTPAAQVPVTDILCNAGGGFVEFDAASPTGFVCAGGVFNGDPVIIT